MKKLFNVAFAVALCSLSSLVMPSCGKHKAMTADESISNAVDSMRLPHVFKDSSILTRMDYTQKVLTFRIEISKEKLNAINVDSMRVHTLSNLRSGLFSQKLVDSIVSANASIRYICVNDNDSVMFTYTPEELK